PHTGHHCRLVHVQAGDTLVDHFHLHSSTPVPPAWGPLPKRNLTSGLQGRIALRRQWGSSRLLGSNSQPGSPAPWSADLFADDPCSIPDQPAHRFHSGRVGRKAGVELAMTGKPTLSRFNTDIDTARCKSVFWSHANR